MTDYLRPITAYVATQNSHRHNNTDRPGRTTQARVSGPDTEADTTEATPDSGADRGWTR
ncbi:hypothetical protein KHQ06_15930 [Nocardia tengchongensis]|uniref:Uncharacterized protein n=1 Tax=Nocardia tengchongensis TaxID=2055889 RepID=A0ABX8CY23_9NOCA|nr:hypothetical protein [Nocardia tengchongensis]QVI24128.1 hypothetical protein KHQ06_15930 [Nocardia tengchongensis]